MKTKKWKTYKITTEYKYGKLVFITKAKDVAKALEHLIENSYDFKYTIKAKKLKISVIVDLEKNRAEFRVGSLL